MFCSHCGKEIPDESRFCNHCGKATSQTATPSEEVEWEHCQIVWDGKHNFWLGGWSNVHFWASVVGKSGQFNAGASPSYHISAYMAGSPPLGITQKDQQNAAVAHAALVKKLIDDKWEPLPHSGGGWWQLSFRRRVKS